MKKHHFFLPLILILFVVASCKSDRVRGSNSEKNESSESETLPSETPLDATVKIYFENTLSMDGYINGNTAFKDVFRDLLVAVDNENDIDLETEFYLINNKLTPTNFGVDNIKISEKLSPNSTANKGNKGSSNFEEILNAVLQNQEGDVISVIMADFIYSPEGEPDVPSALNKLRTYTQNAFLKAGKQDPDLETRIYSFTSDFKGEYYDINNKGIRGIKTRPYYYFVIAPADLMHVFAKNIAPQLKKTSGYQHEALFTSATFPNISTEILSATANNGRIKARGRDIEVVSYPKRGNLEFAVLTDLRELPVADQYLLDKDNYKLTNPEFSIKDIGVVKGKNIDFKEKGIIKMDPSTLVSISNQKFTHAILFEAEGMVSEDLKFALKKRIPAWINKANSGDDRQIRNDSLEKTKTFGFGHLIEGVFKAYYQQSGNDEYFNITIPVK
jgi:hypothetical protein